MPEQIIEIPQNAEVVISITINPCKCDKSVEVPTETETTIPIEEIPSNPVIEPEPTTVIETLIEQPIAPVVDSPSVPKVEPAVSPTVDTPTPEVVPTTEPIQPTPEVQPEVKPTPVEIPTTSPVTLPIEVPSPEVLPIAPILVIDNPIPVPVSPSPEVHNCKLASNLTLAEFTKQLFAATKDLLYPSESDFPIEVLSKGLSTKIPPIKGIEVRNLDRVFPAFLRQADPDNQQSGNVERASIAARWQALYELIKGNSVTTVWHYPVKQKRYTHEELVVMLHPQGTVGLRIRLVET
jgi:Nuclease A inhibitor-like protein